MKRRLPILDKKPTNIIFSFLGSVEMKEMHDDSRESFEIHSQPPLGHPVLHPGLSRPLLPGQQPLHPSAKERPSVIESSQPHIIECT